MDEKTTQKLNFFLGNKGLLIAVIVVILATIIAVFSLGSLGNTSQYQGLIKKVETETSQMGGK